MKSSQNIHLAITGAAGRMGTAIVNAVAQTNMIITQALLADQSKQIGNLVASDDISSNANARVNKLCYTAASSLTDNFDVLIDFSTPAATEYYLAQCIKLRRPMVIGTTGLTERQQQLIKQVAQTIPLVQAPNMSVGINLCYKLLELCSEILAPVDPEWQAAIHEVHHVNKKDAPSGTSLQLASTIKAVFPKLQISSERTGEVTGLHTVTFTANGESLSISHRATNLAIYAHGALRAAQWLTKQLPGLYSMRDVLAAGA